jgi:hypothetical protein
MPHAMWNDTYLLPSPKERSSIHGKHRRRRCRWRRRRRDHVVRHDGNLFNGVVVVVNSEDKYTGKKDAGYQKHLQSITRLSFIITHAKRHVLRASE